MTGFRSEPSRCQTTMAPCHVKAIRCEYGVAGSLARIDAVYESLYTEPAVKLGMSANVDSALEGKKVWFGQFPFLKATFSSTLVLRTPSLTLPLHSFS